MSARGEPGDDDYVDQPQPQGGAPALTPQAQPTIQGPDDSEFEVIETDDRGQPINQPAQDTRLTTDAAGDQPLIRQPQDDGRQQQPAQQPQRRTRSQRRQDNKAEADRRAQMLEEENRQMKDRLANLEGFVAGVQPRIVELGEANIRQQLAGVEQQIADEDARYNAANDKFVSAMSTADTQGAMAAMNERDKALVRRERLSNTKATIEINLRRATDGRPATEGGDRQVQQPQQDGQRAFDVRAPQQPQPPRLNGDGQAHLNQFLRDYDWYDPRGQDVDSRLVAALDFEVHRAGFNPNTQAYWDELDRLMEEKMPWRFRDAPRDDRPGQQPDQRQQQPRQQAQQPARRGPPTAAPAADRPAQANGRKQVKISPDRKEAMMLSGTIDSQGRVLDKAKYLKQLNSFAQYDREHPT